MHQMQLSYVSVEDRILFRVNTKSRQEFRFWMTRRYVDLLWRSLTGLMQQREPSPADPAQEFVQSAKKEIEHQEQVAKSDFKTAYQESTYLPLGEAPALLFSVGVHPGADGRPLLKMHPQKGEGIELALNDQILHSLCKLLSDTARKAEWKLDLRLTPPPKAGDGGSLN